MEGRGSTANVLAAICSFFIPGLGQLVQGRPVTALIHEVYGLTDEIKKYEPGYLKLVSKADPQTAIENAPSGVSRRRNARPNIAKQASSQKPTRKKTVGLRTS